MTDTIAEPKRIGAPTKYTDAMGRRIAELYAEGESFNDIAKRKDEGMPTRETLRVWRWDDEHPLSALLTRARQARAELVAARPGQRYADAQAFLLAGEEDGEGKWTYRNDHHRAGKLITLAEKQDGYDRWYAGTLDARYAPGGSMEALAVAVLSAFSDMRPAIQGEAAVIAPSLPHVTTPDGSSIEAPGA